MKHEETVVVRQTPEKMFNLVLDVESYPEFLPWCHGARIIHKAQNDFDAELTVGLSNFSGSYISKVTFDKENYLINAVYQSGPLKNMETHWHFTNHENGCVIHFSIEFSIKSLFLEKMISFLFNDITKKMTQAFIKRAQLLYKS